MLSSHLGEFAALVTAMSWTIGAMAFELATKRSGSIFVNLMKVFIGFILLSLFTLITRGLAFPVDASRHAWFWLSLSGFVGFVLGDLFLFRAFAIVGSRISMLVLASVPPFTALLGWFVMGEQLLPVHIVGMILTVGGIALVVLERRSGEKQFKFSHPISGILFAFGGALGQSVGLIFSKLGMGSYSAFAATQIRVLTGFIGFFLCRFNFRAVYRCFFFAFGRTAYAGRRGFHDHGHCTGVDYSSCNCFFQGKGNIERNGWCRDCGVWCRRVVFGLNPLLISPLIRGKCVYSKI
jgi:drug/metabolite transporter (DMT)-like permease